MCFPRLNFSTCQVCTILCETRSGGLMGIKEDIKINRYLTMPNMAGGGVGVSLIRLEFGNYILLKKN